MVGDSGIGKSSFLSSMTTWPGEPLVSSPVVLKSVAGSLQTALADAISDCMMQYLNDAPDSRSAWTVLKSVGERASSITGQELGHAVVAGVLTYAELKLGKEIVDVGRKVLGDLAKGGPLGFADQLATIRVPDRARELCNLAAALSKTVGRPLVLRLDNAERLAPDDRGLLAELVDAVAGDVWIVACVTPHNAEGDEIIRQTQMRGLVPHELLPLSRLSIEEWLSAARVPQPQWDSIVRLSSGYPFFIADAVRLSHAGGSLNELASPNGFESLMRASWSGIPVGIREVAAKLAPFADPPSDEFLLEYLGFNVLQWKLLTDDLLESGVFVRRADGVAWFHDRRRAFIWDRVLAPKERAHVAGGAFAALAIWLKDRQEIEQWVPSAAGVLASAADLTPADGLAHLFRSLPDEGIALLWGLIEVIEPGSALAPFAEIGEVVRHAGARSAMDLQPLATLTRLETDGLVETREISDRRLVRSQLRDNTDYAALLGEIQRRFHSTPRPRFASRAFDAFVRPVLGEFDAAFITLGASTLADHKEHAAKLREAQTAGTAEHAPAIGATVSIEGQDISFTAKVASPGARAQAERAMSDIANFNSRVELVRVVTLPRPRLRISRYRLGVDALGLSLEGIEGPDANEITSFLDLRAQYAQALGSVSTPDEVDVLDLGQRRFLVDARTAPGSWTSFEVRTNAPRPTLEVSDVAPNPHDPLLELRLRSRGYLSSGERLVRTTAHFGPRTSIPHPLKALLNDIEEAGNKFNSGLRSLLFAPDPELLEREIRAERERVFAVTSALQSAGAVAEGLQRGSLLVAFWEDSESGWVSDFGNWAACALVVDDNQGATLVRRVAKSPLDRSTWPKLTAPRVFEDYVGASVSSWTHGDGSSILSELLGYEDRDARMTDLDSPLGKLLRIHHDILGEDGTTDRVRPST